MAEKTIGSKAKLEPLGRRSWWGAPQVLLTVFALVVAILYAIGGRSLPTAPAPGPLLGEEGAATSLVEIRYVVVDQEGLERPGFADVPMTEIAAQDPTEVLNAALSALRADLLAQGAWPASVPAPRGYVLLLDRQRVAVIDVRITEEGRPAGATPSRPLTTTAVELGAVRSLVATAQVAVDAAEVRITVDGEPAESLWGSVGLSGR